MGARARARAGGHRTEDPVINEAVAIAIWRTGRPRRERKREEGAACREY